MLFYINLIANLVVAAACLWAVMCPRVNDGWFGKVTLMVLCLAASANAAWMWQYGIHIMRSEILFNVAAACVAIRCYWIKRHRAGFRRLCRGHSCKKGKS